MRRTKAIKHVCGGVFGALLVAGAAAVIATACTHDDSTVFVHGVLQQQLVAPGQTCTFTNDPTQATIASGGLDLDLTNGTYTAMFLVGNQLVPQGNPSAPATETSYVNIQGAVVRITDTSGTQIETYTELLGATIPPSVGTTPGYAAMPVTIVDQPVTAPYEGTLGRNVVRVITYTRFFGKTLGGQSVESNEFEFPVDLCAGCLISFPVGVTDPALFPQPNCGFGAANATSSTTSLPCIPGQDDFVPCTACPGVAACYNFGLTDGGMGGSPTD
jgi:hypothetical protein